MAEEEISQFMKCFDLPMSQLSANTRAWLSIRLNPHRELLSPTTRMLQDWRGLAQLFGANNYEIENFQRLHDPLRELLNSFLPGIPKSLYQFLSALLKIERYDIIADEELYEKLDKDSLKWNSEKVLQDASVSCSNEHSITINGDEKFSAYVCYHKSDRDFIHELIRVLENEHRFSLCIPERDLMLGGATQNDITRLIKTRCHKMIVVLSPRSSVDPDCNFQISFATAIDIRAKQKKILPIILEACTVPDLLIHLSKIDYSQKDIRDWFWKKLIASLGSSTSGNGNTVSIDSGNSSVFFNSAKP